MNNSTNLIDISDSLSSMCQALVCGSHIKFKCTQHEMPAEEAFSAGKLFPVFLDMALKMPPDDEALRVGQCKNFNTLFDIQAIVPSYPGSAVKNKWEDRLRRLVASFETQGTHTEKTIDLCGHFSDFASSISRDKISTFNDVESTLKHFEAAPMSRLRRSRLHSAITPLEDGAAASKDGIIDLDRQYAEWARAADKGQSFWDWHSSYWNHA